ncbi:MAG: hypothetical protein H6648_06580 [Caldilineae bacterium]|nr:hypothetical protein [Chloroflexota bacterium]MCB9176811.1 hypothetical protein [Caldilineae bacterium]
MPKRRARRPRPLVWLVLAVTLATGAARPAAAQQADPRIEAWLFHSIAGIHGASTRPPEVRLLAPDGSQRALGRVGARSAEGRWPVDFSPDTPFGEPRVLTRPGDRIEVRLDGQRIEHVVPALEASADEAEDAILGQAPAGTVLVAALLHRDPAWYSAPSDYPVKTAPNPGGAFRFDFAGEADIRAGYWAEAAAVDGAGHLTILQLAPPAVTLADTQAFAILRADAGRSPVLSTRNRIDTELFRSGPAYALGGALYAVLMVPDGNPDFGIYRPTEGERVLLQLDPSPATEPILDEPLPRALASIDASAGTVWGYAPAGARVDVQLTERGSDSRGRGLSADAAGRFEADFGAPIGDPAAEASVQVHPGGGLARVARARAPDLELLLYANHLSGSVPGWGRLRLEHRDAADRLLAWLELEAGPEGELEADLLDAGGAATRFEPGSRLIVAPELGRRLELEIPRLTADANPAERRLEGLAPAGARLVMQAYQREPSIFDGQPFAADRIEVSGQAAADGRFALVCPTADCLLGYGTLQLVDRPLRYTLQWLASPIVGIGVTQRAATGRASAGLPLALHALDARGQPRASLEGLTGPLAPDSLPGWDIDLAPLYPEGIVSGDRIALRVGDRDDAIEVPDFDWDADVATNRVVGRGPAGRLVAVVAFARGLPMQRPANALATTLVGPLGRWQADFEGFDLRAGDDLELYVFDRADRFLWWAQDAIPGIDPPTATTAPTGTVTAGPRPSATPSAPATWPSLYLPRLLRSRSTSVAIVR